MRHLEFNEAREHTTGGFPIAYYLASRDALYPPQFIHWHREFEVGRVLTGSLSYYIGNKFYHLEEGDCYFARSGILHGCRKMSCDFESVVFDLDTIMNNNNSQVQEITKKIVKQAKTPVYYLQESPEICKIIETLIVNCRNDIRTHIMSIIGTLFLLFGWIDEHNLYEPEADELSTMQEERLQHVLSYIENNYDSQITLSDLADCIGMSPCYFTSFFTTNLHRSPINYLNYYRIEKACTLLLNSDNSVTDIAFQTGFNSSSYFVKMFKKYKGITPKQYQQHINQSRPE